MPDFDIIIEHNPDDVAPYKVKCGQVELASASSSDAAIGFRNQLHVVQLVQLNIDTDWLCFERHMQSLHHNEGWLWLWGGTVFHNITSPDADEMVAGDVLVVYREDLRLPSDLKL